MPSIFSRIFGGRSKSGRASHGMDSRDSGVSSEASPPSTAMEEAELTRSSFSDVAPPSPGGLAAGSPAAPPVAEQTDASLETANSTTPAGETAADEASASGGAVGPVRPEQITSGKHPELEEAIVKCLRTIYDPEIPVNIYDLGLIYRVEPDSAGKVLVRMTLTSPSCPAAEIIPPEVSNKVKMVEGVADVQLDLVWEPTWSPDMMTDAAKLELNML